MSDIDNPWREFIENCISGDNYFRASEYRELLADLDRGYAAEARLAEAEGLLREALPHIAATFDGFDPDDNGWSEERGLFARIDAHLARKQGE